jgi:hypothetical protein
VAKQRPDKRMGWIRSVFVPENQGTSSIIEEHEFVSDSEIAGILKYADGRMVCGPLTFRKDSNGFYKYLLRLTVAYPQGGLSFDAATAKGYYFKEGVVGEILSLISLYLQCRVFLVASSMNTSDGMKVRDEKTPLMIPAMPYFDPSPRHAPEKRNFALGFRQFLDQIASVPDDQHHSLALASWHYALALQEFGLDEEMVFIRLVSAIEACCGGMKLSKREDRLFDLSFEDMIRTEKLDAGQIQELKEIVGHRKAMQRFISFIDHYSTGFIRSGNYSAKHTHISRKDLPDRLKAIYSSRSAYLHRGESMYISRPMNAKGKWDTDSTFGMIIDRKKFRYSEKLPCSDYFQRLVRHVLLQFCRELSRKKQA